MALAPAAWAEHVSVNQAAVRAVLRQGTNTMQDQARVAGIDPGLDDRFLAVCLAADKNLYWPSQHGQYRPETLRHFEDKLGVPVRYLEQASRPTIRLAHDLFDHVVGRLAHAASVQDRNLWSCADHCLVLMARWVDGATADRRDRLVRLFGSIKHMDRVADLAKPDRADFKAEALNSPGMARLAVTLNKMDRSWRPCRLLIKCLQASRGRYRAPPVWPEGKESDWPLPTQACPQVRGHFMLVKVADVRQALVRVSDLKLRTTLRRAIGLRDGSLNQLLFNTWTFWQKQPTGSKRASWHLVPCLKKLANLAEGKHLALRQQALVIVRSLGPENICYLDKIIVARALHCSNDDLLCSVRDRTTSLMSLQGLVHLGQVEEANASLALVKLLDLHSDPVRTIRLLPKARPQAQVPNAFYRSIGQLPFQTWLVPKPLAKRACVLRPGQTVELYPAVITVGPFNIDRFYRSLQTEPASDETILAAVNAKLDTLAWCLIACRSNEQALVPNLAALRANVAAFSWPVDLNLGTEPSPGLLPEPTMRSFARSARAPALATLEAFLSQGPDREVRAIDLLASKMCRANGHMQSLVDFCSDPRVDGQQVALGALATSLMGTVCCLGFDRAFTWDTLGATKQKAPKHLKPGQTLYRSSHGQVAVPGSKVQVLPAKLVKSLSHVFQVQLVRSTASRLGLLSELCPWLDLDAMHLSLAAAQASVSLEACLDAMADDQATVLRAYAETGGHSDLTMTVIAQSRVHQAFGSIGERFLRFQLATDLTDRQIYNAFKMFVYETAADKVARIGKPSGDWIKATYELAGAVDGVPVGRHLEAGPLQGTMLPLSDWTLNERLGIPPLDPVSIDRAWTAATWVQAHELDLEAQLARLELADRTRPIRAAAAIFLGRDPMPTPFDDQTRVSAADLINMCKYVKEL